MRYRPRSPARSTTSQSDQDDDLGSFADVSKAIAVSPAQWSSNHQHRPTTSLPNRRQSPMSLVPAELLISILKYLYTPRDIFNALCVNRTWCQCSVELLWHKPNILGVSTLIKMIKVLSSAKQTFQYAGLIRRLNFLALGVDLVDSMFLRLGQCDRLERLTLVNCVSLSGDALACVLSRCPNLVAIDLTAVAETSDKAIINLATSAKRLQGINLTGCRMVTDDGVYALADNCPMLRRVKLSGVDQVTDEPISALAKSCPLLLEMDLNNCKLVTDVAVRDIWMYSAHMRELRLSHLSELTDAAFPAPLKPSNSPPTSSQAPLGVYNSRNTEQLPPLVINRTFEHLRMLDLTACSLITDDAIEGVISHAPKIRNLVLSKCVLLTDRSVENICSLDRHIHYLHLGHASKITDRSVYALVRSCTRLRYVDFANCTNLTDMSVFELSALQKLRRIGLVRVDKLTDEAVYALAERHATLERIHLSYCDQISVMAIHFLLQKLHKLTHLSLTGIPAFRQDDIQQFCRQPPADFNVSQRAAFCVYSGKGVSDLRAFLTEHFDHMNENNATDDTEYEDDEYDNYQEGDTPEPMETDYEVGEDEEDQGIAPIPPAITSQRPSRHMNQPPTMASVQHSHSQRQASYVLTDSTEVMNPPGRWVAPAPAAQRHRGNPHQVLIEPSQTPPPRPPLRSNHSSSRAAGPNHHSRSAFRGYQEAAIAASSSASNGALTPELDFAEIGHGRGASSGQVDGRPTYVPTSRHPPWSEGPSSLPNATGSPPVFEEPESPELRPSAVAQKSAPYPTRDAGMDIDDDEVIIPSHIDEQRRGRSVRRSLKNTLTVAEHYASNVLFGRGERGGGSTSNSQGR